MAALRFALASDHAGFALKQLLAEDLRKAGHSVEDFGCTSDAAVDLSDHVAPAAEALGIGRFDRGLFVDGAGYSSGMIANLFHGVFAAVCNDPLSARIAREHGAANALCLGAMIIGTLTAKEILKAFLEGQPLPGKYADRRAKVERIAEEHRVGPLFRTRQVVTVEDLKQAVLNKEPLILGPKTVITPSVVDAVRNLRP